MSTAPTTTIVIAQQKVDVEAEYQALIDGINTVYPTDTQFVLNGETIQRADLLGRFQKRIDAAKTTKSMRADLKAQVQAEKAVDGEVRPLRAAMKRLVETREGLTSPKLQKFGFAERKSGKTKPSVKAQAVVLANATRKLRGTTSKKAKAAIRATAPAPAVSPTVPAQPAPATPAAPSPATPPANAPAPSARS